MEESSLRVRRTQTPSSAVSPRYTETVAFNSASPGSSAGSLSSNSRYQHSRRLTTVTRYTDFSDVRRYSTAGRFKRVFRWLYSVSLAIFIILTTAFITVTPIDVIAQTSGASSSAVKMFIVVAVCVAFVVLSAILYFLRIYQHRVALNDIPSKSVYVPGEHDMPKAVYQRIEKKLRECVADIRPRAGPLHDGGVINHPGMAPPEYVQRRNKGANGEGTLLPPNANYEDIIRGLGDKWRSDAPDIYQMDISPHHSFRERVIVLTTLKKAQQGDFDVKKTIALYEKLKFGPGLIKERDLLEFMIQMDKFAHWFSTGDFDSRKRPKKLSRAYSAGQASESSYHNVLQATLYGKGPSKSDIQFANSDLFDYHERDSDYYSHSGDSEAASSVEKPHYDEIERSHAYSTFYGSNSFDSVIQPPPKWVSSGERHVPENWDTSSMQRFSRLNRSDSSTGSVIKNKLAMSNASHVRLEQRPSVFGGASSYSKRNSGYSTDSEHAWDYDFPTRASQDEADSDGLGIYSFRASRPLDQGPSAIRLSDVSIRRLRSPEKRRRLGQGRDL